MRVKMILIELIYKPSSCYSLVAFALFITTLCLLFYFLSLFFLFHLFCFYQNNRRTFIMKNLKNYDIGEMLALVVLSLLAVGCLGTLFCFAAQLFGIVPTVAVTAIIAWVIATM
jgi:hypothetical protein